MKPDTRRLTVQALPRFRSKGQFVVALSTWVPEDGLLGAIAPLALAASRTTALVVDLDPGGPSYPGPSSLAQLVDDGPRAADLSPRRRGLAVLRNGGIDAASAGEVVAALVDGWPHVVLRLPASEPEHRAGVVPVRSLFVNDWFEPVGGRAVYQTVLRRMQPPGPGVVLPRPRASTVAALLGGVRPGGDRWLRVWRSVWEEPWA